VKHKTGVPECSIGLNGTKFWELNNVFHRLDGPAIEWTNGDKQWRVNGRQHRTDGPAVMHSDGYKEWWFHGEPFFSEEEFIKHKQLQLLEEQDDR